jgi:cytochrome o ubiquinol oxidase subunit I
MLGKLSWSAIPFDEPLPLISGVAVAAVILAVLALVTAKGWWPYLWREWLTSVDHKRIGVMYVTLGLVMLLRGFSDAIMMRLQQALAIGNAHGYLPPDHYNQVFSAHGTIMIFFVAMPLVIGLMNFVVPLQLGVRDVAFPVLNSVSFWLTAAGALLVNFSLVIGNFARTGWMGYPPLSGIAFSPDVGVDYYLWSLQISGIGTLLTGVNFVTTILKLRAPGMTYFRMPVFCWTALAANLLIVAAFPILTATYLMLLLDRYLGMHFFTNEAGGNQMMYVNLFWAWGHPEVYILILPAFGVFSEVAATFSGKSLFSYRSMVLATMGICVLSFMVWLHHFFTMGAGADVNAFFGVMSAIIAVPTGVKVFNWLFTMFRGRIVFRTPMLFLVGFMATFVIGGMTGVLLAVPPIDFVLHNSAFLVAHFHNVIIGGVVFGALAGPGQLLVLARRLLSGLHAAVCAGPVGDDAAPPAHRRSYLAAHAAGRGIRCGRHPLRHPLPDRSALCQHPHARAPPRRDRRPLERSDPGMGDLVATPGLQLRGAAPCRGHRRILGDEAERGPAARGGVRSDRDAA